MFFWTNHATIYIRTLSGIDLGVCHAPMGEASSLAIDAVQRRLFWLSGTATGQPLTISQMEYNSTSCNNERQVKFLEILIGLHGLMTRAVCMHNTSSSSVNMCTHS